MTYKLKIDVKTPKNQAEQCMKTQKTALLGVKKSKEVLEEKLVKHNEFYWIIQVDSDKQEREIIYKCAKGEVTIRNFYKALFKLIHRANKLGDKFNKGYAWMRRWMVKKLKKQMGSDQELIKKVENMSDEEIKDFIKISDKEEMDKLLSGDMITVHRQ